MYAPYTQSPGQSDGAIFPTNGMSILSSTIHLSGMDIDLETAEPDFQIDESIFPD
jgi:hypothetical protein